MIGAEDKRLGSATDDMQPTKHTGIRYIWLLLVGIALQHRDVAAVIVGAEHTGISKSGTGKIFYEARFTFLVTRTFR